MKATLPKISVITPSYNQGKFIERTILSVLNQDYPNLEYIIIDGGSTDQSVDVIKKYETQLTYWVSEKDKGTYHANNKALEKVTGDFWCVVNSDDVLLPGAIYKLVESMTENPHKKWFAGGVHYIDESDQVTGMQIPDKPEAVAGYTFLHGCWISHPTVFIHRDMIQEVGVFEKYHLMDMNYWLRMERAGHQPHIIDAYLAGLRDHQDCKSADRIKLHEEYLSVFDSFVKKHQLNTQASVRAKIRYNNIFHYRLLLSESLVSSKRIKATGYLVKLTALQPASVLERWYIGAVKRILMGVSPDDPLVSEFSAVENKANWSNE